MDNERLKIVQALNQFYEPININELITESGLSRGKVLGNLARLCIDGFVDKRGKQYAITNRGKAVIEELNPISQDKGFYFYLDENNSTGQVAISLKDFYEIMKMIDIKSLEFHTRRGDFENWIRDLFHDTELASEIAALRNENITGETLRDKLHEAVGRNYRMINSLTIQHL